MECIFSVVGDNSVVFNQNVICPHTFSTVQCLAEIYMGCVSVGLTFTQWPQACCPRAPAL